MFYPISTQKDWLFHFTSTYIFTAAMARSLCALNLPLELHSSVARCQRATTHPTDRLLRLQTFLQACRAKARTRHTENLSHALWRQDDKNGSTFKKTSKNNGLKTTCSLTLIQILGLPTQEKMGVVRGNRSCKKHTGPATETNTNYCDNGERCHGAVFKP